MIEIDYDNCCGCNYCTLSCGEEAFSYVEYQIIVDSEKCADCGACVYYCPVKAIRVVRED